MTISSYFGGQDNFFFKIVLLDRFDCTKIQLLSKSDFVHQFFAINVWLSITTCNTQGLIGIFLTLLVVRSGFGKIQRNHQNKLKPK